MKPRIPLNTPASKFSIDKPILPGFIYMIQQGNVKKVCSTESLPFKNLVGHWNVKITWKK